MTRANLNISPLNVYSYAGQSNGAYNTRARVAQAASSLGAQLLIQSNGQPSIQPHFEPKPIGLNLNSNQLVQALGGVLQTLCDLHIEGKLIASPFLACFEVQPSQGQPSELQVRLSSLGHRCVAESYDISAMRKALSDVTMQFNDLFLQRIQYSPCLLDGLTACRAVDELAPLLQSENGIRSADLRLAQSRIY